MADIPSLDDVGNREFVQRILSAASKVTRIAIQAGRDDVVGRLDTVERQLRADEFTVVVLGQFSSGKSSLLNALLEETEGLFPVDSYLSTRAVTSARWAPAESITLSLAGSAGAPVQERVIGRAELRGYISEAEVQDETAAADADRVRAVSVELPSPKLRDGLVLIDTPGIGGVIPGHVEAALGVLSSASGDSPDMVLYVMDAGRLPLPSELSFIERVAQAVNAQEFPERLLFVIAKADQEGDWEALAAEGRARLSAAPGVGERSAVLPVSSETRLRQVSGEEPLDDTLTGFGLFEELLRRDAARTRLRLRAGSAIAELDLAVDTLLGPVRSALDVLSAEDAATRAQLEARAERQRAEADRLTAGAADWPQDLNRALAQVQASLAARVTADLAGIWAQVRAGYREDSSWLDDPQLIVDELAGRLALLVGQLGREATARTEEACTAIAASSGLRLPPPTIDGIAVPPLPQQPTAGERILLADNLGLVFAAAKDGAERGAKVGATLGHLIWDQAAPALLGDGPLGAITRNAVEAAADGIAPPEPVGAFVGRVVGASVGALLAVAAKAGQISQLDRAQRITTLDELFAPHEAEQLAFLQDAVRGIVQAGAAAAEADLRGRIAQRQSECRAAASEVAAATAAAGRDLAAAELTARAAALAEIEHLLAELTAEFRTRVAQRAS
jgi:Dynamin family